MAFSTADGPRRLRDALTAHGGARVTLTAGVDTRSPWSLAEALLGVAPAMVEQQVIRAVEGGRSFSSGAMDAPWHTDSQCFLGAPPDLQVMRCVRAASRGGESLYLDTRPLLERLERDDPALFRQVFFAARRMPFVFGDVYGPTMSLRRGRVVFTQTPRVTDGDRVGERVEKCLADSAFEEFIASPGEVTVIDNHRVLHGRRAFEDVSREFVRVLVWLRDPLPAHAGHRALAEQARAALSERLAGASADVRSRFGLAEPVEPEVRRRVAVVLEMLRGASPGMLAGREKIPEPWLYRWRDLLLSGGEEALAHDARSPERAAQALEAAWKSLR